VEFGPHDRRFVDIQDLEPVSVQESIGDLLLDCRFGKKGDLARILTYYKVSSRLANVFYAMQTSRTDFYAYQFKPVYKFIESANGRILIADEVGLGKTIEAGLIWQEVKARTGATRLLVICPSMLRAKWKQELRQRFYVQAEIYDSRGFLSLLEDFEREQSQFQCAAVCSMEGLRSARIRDALVEFSKSGLSFDLAVIDEAHYMRNVETNAHRLGQIVSEVAEHLILLTATPVHLKNEDLYRLLNVLDRDEYSMFPLFEDRLKANEPVVAAQNALRNTPVDLKAARAFVQELPGSRWFGNNPLTQIAVSRVESLELDNNAEIIEASRVLENLNLFGATVSRTRKREVQEWRVIREAKVLDLEFSPQEMAFYNKITQIVRRRVSDWGNQAFEAFALMMPQRQMASCIPAMVEHYREVLSEEEAEEMMEEDLGLGKGDRDVKAGQVDPEIATIVSEWRPGFPDSKFDALIEELKRLFEAEPDVKIVIFSYFKKTIEYLRRRLTSEGLAPAVIHGGIDMESRLPIIEDFMNNPHSRVLISSEVGAEGIDLQFCRVIVNYDLPWNPMKVEQRIGRIDRLGQKNEKVTIVNIAARGTIEERILNRLYKRIGIFERSIGDLEPILGEMIQRLTFDLLSGSLTARQEEERIGQTRKALEEKRRLETDLEDRSSLFFGSSDFILQEIRQARRTGRWVTPVELRGYVSDFFQHRYRGTQVVWDSPEKGLVSMRLSNEARFELSSFCRRGQETRTMLVNGSKEPMTLGYKSDAIRDRTDRLEFLSHFHPLVHWITEQYTQETKPFYPVSAVEARSSLVKPGDYLFFIELWRFMGSQNEVQIAYSLARLNGSTAEDAATAEILVQEILGQAENWGYADSMIERRGLERALTMCEKDIQAQRETAYEVFEGKTTGAAQRRIAHLENHLARKEGVFENTVRNYREQLRDEPADRKRRQIVEGRIKGEETKRENLRQKIRDEITEMQNRSKCRLEFTEVAAGVCRVKR
jgi:superfamily II DNA/RNA helicase